MNKVIRASKLVFYNFFEIPRKIKINDKIIKVRYNLFWQSVELGRWENDTFEIFDKYLKPEHIFVDIGAWNGITSLYAANIVNKCYSIEPDKVALNDFEDNLNLNPKLKEKINLYKYCLAKEEGKYNLYSGQHGNSTSSLIKNDDRKNIMEVEGKTFIQFLEDNNLDKVNFIKMDIEGAESFILPSMKHYFAYARPILYLSLHLRNYKNESEVDEIVDVLSVFDSFSYKGVEFTLDEVRDKLINRDNFELLMTFNNDKTKEVKK